MRLVAVSRLLNEADILEAFVRHTAFFVDHHIFIDNGSVDGSVRILEELKKEGLPLAVYQSRARSFVETRLNTFLYQTAVSQYQADWVVFLDVDEFIDDRALQVPFRDTIARFGAENPAPTCMSVALREYHMVASDPDDLLVLARIKHCSPTSANMKVVVRSDLAQRRLIVQPGNHGVMLDGNIVCPLVAESSLSYAHFATRSVYQWISKSVIGWAKILASGEDVVRSGYSYHYKAPFEVLRDTPQAILRDPRMLLTPSTPDELTLDPVVYRGDALRYTDRTDYSMRSVQVVMQYLQELASQHGELLRLSAGLTALINRTESGVTPLL